MVDAPVGDQQDIGQDSRVREVRGSGCVELVTRFMDPSLDHRRYSMKISERTHFCRILRARSTQCEFCFDHPKGRAEFPA